MSAFDHAFPGGVDEASLAYRQQQRRKVNTCLQCKTRKVKCDKVRPHCGPCQRRRIPVERCIWAEEADPDYFQPYAAAAVGPGGASGTAAMDWLSSSPSSASSMYDPTPVPPSGAGSSLLGLSETDARAVLERISRLEMKMRDTGPDFGAIGSNLGETSSGSTVVPAQSQQIDAAVLAGAAHARAVHSAGGSAGPPISPPTEPVTMPVKARTNTGVEVISLVDDEDEGEPPMTDGLSIGLGGAVPGSPFPFSSLGTKEHIEVILGSLPNDHTVNLLLDSFRFLESLAPLGISWRLFRVQLINLRGDVADWRNGHVEDVGVDLSFLALLFEVMVAAAECKDAGEMVREAIAPTVEQIPELIARWHATCLALLSMAELLDQPNLNTVLALHLCRVHLSKQRQYGLLNTYASLTVALARKLGLHALGSAHDDAARWQSHPEEDDATIRTGPITAVRKAHFHDSAKYRAAEEADLVRRLLAQKDNDDDNAGALLPRREDDTLEQVLPDRSHLVRESARMLWIQLRWQSAVAGGGPAAMAGDTTTVTIEEEEGQVPDGEDFDVPSSSSGGRDASSLAVHAGLGRILAVLPVASPDGQGTEILAEKLGRAAPALATGASSSPAHQTHVAVQVLTAHWLSLRLTRTHLRPTAPARLATLALESAHTILVAFDHLSSVPGLSRIPLNPWLDTAVLQAGLVLVLHALFRIGRDGPPPLTDPLQRVKTSIDRIASSFAPAPTPTGTDETATPKQPSLRPGVRLLSALLRLAETRQTDTARRPRTIKVEGDTTHSDPVRMDVDPSPPRLQDGDGDGADLDRALDAEGTSTERERLGLLRPYFDAIRDVPYGPGGDAGERQVVDLDGFWSLLEGVV